MQNFDLSERRDHHSEFKGKKRADQENAIASKLGMPLEKYLKISDICRRKL